MRINPISVNFDVKRTPNVRNINHQTQVQFQGKHSGAKWGAIIFGTMATAGAIGGTIIMSGGLAAIPWAAAYIGLGAGAGAMIGHSVDKNSKDFDKKA